jgi:hypothetical protein
MGSSGKPALEACWKTIVFHFAGFSVARFGMVTYLREYHPHEENEKGVAWGYQWFNG